MFNSMTEFTDSPNDAAVLSSVSKSKRINHKLQPIGFQKSDQKPIPIRAIKKSMAPPKVPPKSWLMPNIPSGTLSPKTISRSTSTKWTPENTVNFQRAEESKFQEKLRGLEYCLQADISAKVTYGSPSYFGKVGGALKMCFHNLLQECHQMKRERRNDETNTELEQLRKSSSQTLTYATLKKVFRTQLHSVQQELAEERFQFLKQRMQLEGEIDQMKTNIHSETAKCNLFEKETLGNKTIIMELEERLKHSKCEQACCTKHSLEERKSSEIEKSLEVPDEQKLDHTHQDIHVSIDHTCTSPRSTTVENGQILKLQENLDIERYRTQELQKQLRSANLQLEKLRCRLETKDFVHNTPEMDKTEDRLDERVNLIRRSECVETGEISILSQVKPSVWKILSPVDVALLFTDPLLPDSCLDFIIQWAKKLNSQIYRMKDYFSIDVIREAELLKHGAVIQERLDISLIIAIIKDNDQRKKMADALDSRFSYSPLSSSLEAVVNELTSETSFLLEVYEKTNGYWYKVKGFVDQMLPLIVGGLIATAVHENCINGIVTATANLQLYNDQMDKIEQKIQSIFDRCRSEVERNMLSDLNEVLDSNITNEDAVNRLSDLMSEKYDWLMNYCIVCNESNRMDYGFVGNHVESLKRNKKFGVIFYRDALMDETFEYTESSDVASLLESLASTCNSSLTSAKKLSTKIVDAYRSRGIEVKACAVLRQMAPPVLSSIRPISMLIYNMAYKASISSLRKKGSCSTVCEYWSEMSREFNGIFAPNRNKSFFFLMYK